MIPSLGGEIIKAMTLRFPDDLHKELKIYAAVNGTTMHDVIIKLIKQKLEEENKETPAE